MKLVSKLVLLLVVACSSLTDCATTSTKKEGTSSDAQKNEGTLNKYQIAALYAKKDSYDKKM